MKRGDVVQLKSGGPLMTIEAIELNSAAVCWMDDAAGASASGVVHKTWINIECLKEASPQTAAECMDFIEKAAPGRLKGLEEFLRPLSNPPASVEEQVEQAAPKTPFRVRSTNGGLVFEVWSRAHIKGPMLRASFAGPNAELDAKAHAERLCRRHKVTGE